MPILIGKNSLKLDTTPVTGEMISLEGERFYKIVNFRSMPPFFMSVVSASDHWMFISSNGALSAGRKNPDNALFPYLTDDRITDSPEVTGAKTILFAEKNSQKMLWEPLSERNSGIYNIRSNLYKSAFGNKLIFEEENLDLGIVFRYGWYNSEKFGFVRKSEITNRGERAVGISILDGIQNILPYGVPRIMQDRLSTLVDAYKKNELLLPSGIGIYYLSSIPTDKAEPSEGLKATIAWSIGLEAGARLVSSRQLDAYRTGRPITQEQDIRAARGAYFTQSGFNLEAGETRVWYTVTELCQDAADITRLRRTLAGAQAVPELIEADIAGGTRNLRSLVAASDGIEITRDELASHRHFGNTLYNIMRGGIFDNGYQVCKKDFARHLEHCNRSVAEKHRPFIARLNETLHMEDLVRESEKTRDPDLIRLCREYLPLSFSRRHGDPSRPWNQFSIETKKADGSRSLFYAGNWRDIFQNWEALCISFPGYLEHIICKFVNASTADGYNPYRISRDGIEWELVDHHDPWSHIGYWGDHQIIYLLKLLEQSDGCHPGELAEFLSRDIFVYANVPYRIKPHCEIVRNPKETIDFDDALEAAIRVQVEKTGSDGKLLRQSDGSVCRANLAEKLLVPLLVKLGNFIPGAGIWMNTQRPEWNDANNALVGSGASMVTLSYLYRYVGFCKRLFARHGEESFPLAVEIAEFLSTIGAVLDEDAGLTDGEAADRTRREILELLGNAGSRYREHIYRSGFSRAKTTVRKEILLVFFDTVLATIAHSIRSNRREDGLYHAYNLVTVSQAAVTVRRLDQMLEGQVAVLSSGLLSPTQATAVLDALQTSRLYREDQQSYLLYPDRELKKFIDKNNIPADKVAESALLSRLAADRDQRIIVCDPEGGYHFNGSFRNSGDLQAAIGNLSGTTYENLAAQEHRMILDLFEDVFDHHSFTGRSGTFFGYEGLGCIYWHMVSKLLLAVAENHHWAAGAHADARILAKLTAHFREIRKGIGAHKSPAAYGAFPLDAYSHTPDNSGVRQPGMTGQVKEDILSRFIELGVGITDGRISFAPLLLQDSEFLEDSRQIDIPAGEDPDRKMTLEAGTLFFTLCSITVIYRRTGKNHATVLFKSGKTTDFADATIDTDMSRRIMRRDPDIDKIIVDVNC